MISIYSTLTSGLNPADSLHSGRFVLLGSSILIDAHLKYLGRVLEFQRQSRAAVECHSGSIRNVQIPFLLFHTTFYIGRHRVPIKQHNDLLIPAATEAFLIQEQAEVAAWLYSAHCIIYSMYTFQLCFCFFYWTLEVKILAQFCSFRFELYPIKVQLSTHSFIISILTFTNNSQQCIYITNCIIIRK